MPECGGDMQSQVEPWYNLVEPWKCIEESSRAK